MSEKMTESTYIHRLRPDTEKKLLGLLGFAARARKLICGTDLCRDAIRRGQIPLALVASDASDHTWRRAKSFVAGTAQQTLRVPFTKAELGFAVGRQELAIAAFTDAAMAASFVKALPEPEKHKAVLEALEIKAARQRQRQKEAKAHEKNKRMGKK